MSRNLLFSVLAVGMLTGCLSGYIGEQPPAPVTYYGRQEGAGSAGVHTVVDGDTLYSISERYKIAMRDIAVHNRLEAPFRLSTGQRLNLPPPMEYKARAGDTLYSVSRLFGVNTSEIAALNNMKAPYVIRGGQVLRLPSITRKTVPVTAQIARSDSARKTPPLPPGSKPMVSIPQPVESQQRLAQQPAPEAKRAIKAQTPKRSSSKFGQPVEGTLISSFGPKPDGLHNDGINIRASRGAPVKAAENGVVVYAGNELKGSGNLILIRHEDRWMTAYAHLDRIDIKRGDIVQRGQTIGTVGSTGTVDEPQLHFEVRRGTEALNPTRYLEG